jgi:CheY-like chemotaxis protein
MKSVLLGELRGQESATRIRVLILENDPQDVELMLLELRASGFDPKYRLAQDKEQFLTALKEETFDAILADYRLPSWSGLEALKELRANGKDIPFLLVTATLGEEAAVECMKQGVN